MKLYVARHGQTEWNAADRVCGVTDVELTSHGVEQAELMAEKLAEKRLDIIISSPLSRARKTAEIIARRLQKEALVDHRLVEQNYGIFEGANRKDESFKQAKSQFPNRLSGGESILQVSQRVFNLLDETKEKYRNEQVLLVSHGSVCRVIHAYFNELLNEEFYAYYLGNGEWREYEFEK
ncbi:histidine phosphatase family protein [Paenibacillus soyae]|uniref:Histidine phosphatase family protein n=1 Tax=Paenibacillus soyae TaxID=2969249 RepID=A0A9X2MPU4_9BACL|nr:histidine phosphatase family protein [Paenibacillus soyae]MCR2804654.1 histidine phosphatase family protein [Paenibacillus soyae]